MILSILKDFGISLGFAVLASLIILSLYWPPTPPIVILAAGVSQFIGWFSLALLRIRKWKRHDA